MINKLLALGTKVLVLYVTTINEVIAFKLSGNKISVFNMRLSLLM